MRWRRLFEAGRVKPEILRAEQLVGWLHTGWTEPFISLPDICQRGPSAVRDKETAKKTVAILADRGRHQAMPEGAVVDGRRRCEAWRIMESSR